MVFWKLNKNIARVRNCSDNMKLSYLQLQEMLEITSGYKILKIVKHRKNCETALFNVWIVEIVF